MRIRNRTRKTLLGTRVMRAASFFSRLRGYLGRPQPRPGEGILLVDCNAIHTWWLSFPLDVLFLNDRGEVISLARSVPPWKVIRSPERATYVLEVPVGTVDASDTQIGDELSWGHSLPDPASLLSSRDRIRGSSSQVRTRSGSKT